MALHKVTGTKVAVDLQVDLRSVVDAPSIVVYDPARAFWKTLALRLLGVTALTDSGQVDAVRKAAAALVDADDKDWTVADAQKLLAAAGTLPAPGHLQVWRMPGQATILFRAVAPETPKARRMTYPSRSARPSISILAALRPEGIVIPKGMCMDVPVKLVEDDEGLALAAFFRRGKLRDATEVVKEASAAVQPAGEGK
ncbi:MAG TPA: hypothetical protein VNT01_03150 [Symbiobacteriaceae bacterium]|nr:hypothetical protein [Symbiobacteriaceae bacterium]